MQPLHPCLVLPCYVFAEISLKLFIHYLSLTISLSVVASAQGEICPTYLEKILPKETHEPTIMITNNSTRQPMQPKFLFGEQLCYMYCCVHGYNGKEMCKLYQPIHHYIDTIPTLDLRQAYDEIY